MPFQWRIQSVEIVQRFDEPTSSRQRTIHFGFHSRVCLHFLDIVFVGVLDRNIVIFPRCTSFALETFPNPCWTGFGHREEMSPAIRCDGKPKFFPSRVTWAEFGRSLVGFFCCCAERHLLWPRRFLKFPSLHTHRRSGRTSVRWFCVTDEGERAVKTTWSSKIVQRKRASEGGSKTREREKRPWSQVVVNAVVEPFCCFCEWWKKHSLSVQSLLWSENMWLKFF